MAGKRTEDSGYHRNGRTYRRDSMLLLTVLLFLMDLNGSVPLTEALTSPIPATGKRPACLPQTFTPMPDPLPELKNSFYLLRHGQSTANVAGIISSARSLAGSSKHGLTPLGWEQGRASAEQLLDLIEKDGNEGKRIYFYSSSFARACQTADACIQGLQSEENKKKLSKLNLEVMEEEIGVEDGIMERYFGRLDGKALMTYAYVWPVDMIDNTHTAFDVESVSEVATRVGEAIRRIDACHNGEVIVLTSHADTLQITQLYAANFPNVGAFSQYRFTNGEVRSMKRTPDSLPDAEPLKPPKIGT